MNRVDAVEPKRVMAEGFRRQTNEAGEEQLAIVSFGVERGHPPKRS
jgi:hypothetical protein